MRRLRLLSTLFLTCLYGLVAAQEHSHDHASAAVPLSVMGSHLHKSGEWMFSYQYMNMQMDGNRIGTSSVSNQDIFNAGYLVAPLRMDMQMHMLGAMYGLTDSTSLMLMAPYIINEMDHVTVMNVPFTTSSEGWGDLKLTAIFGILNQHTRQFLISTGVSLPTGSIDERDNTPMMANAKLPYPMQLGSGTYDVLLGATYLTTSDSWTLGVQGQLTIRTGENENQYTLGDRYEVTAWTGKKFAAGHSGTLRLVYADWQNIDGADPELNPMMVPTADPDLRAGKRADLAIGYQFKTQQNSLGIEYSISIYQNLDGPQLETDNILSLNWQYAL